MNPPRALLLAVAASLLTTSCGSDGDGGASKSARAEPHAGPGLRVERSEGPRGTELVVYVEDGADNVLETTRGRRSVTLRCFGSDGRLLVRDRKPWPFTDTDEGLVEAHIHQRTPRSLASRVSRCELGGTRGPLRGEVTTDGFR